jgi:hypothetical protein
VTSVTAYLPRPCFERGQGHRGDGTMKLLLPLIAFISSIGLLISGSGAGFGYL